MSARVGRSGSEGKPAVETKPRETVLFRSLPTWATAKANLVPQSCMQPRNIGLVGAPHRVPVTSTYVSAHFHAYRCLWKSSRWPPAEGPVPLMRPCLPLRVARSRNLWELSMTKAIPDESEPNAILTRPWSRYVHVGWTGGDKSSNSGLYISARTSK